MEEKKIVNNIQIYSIDCVYVCMWPKYVDLKEDFGFPGLYLSVQEFVYL